MALFDGVNTLEDALGRSAETEGMSISNQFARKRRQAISQQAKAGRLGSGVSNYQFGDLAAEEAGAYGDVESGLAEALGQIPTQDYLTQEEDARKLQLAELIGRLNKPKSNVLGGLLSGAGSGAIAGANFGPWGALIGGGLGAALGGFSGSEG